MNEVLIHVKSRFDGSVQPARCKHCKFLQTEFDLNDNISFFGFCSFFHARKVRGNRTKRERQTDNLFAKTKSKSQYFFKIPTS